MAFGRYLVDSLLARGGMGEVWLATAYGPGGFQKRVVIKTVLPDLMEKPGYVDMLVKEASLAARLNHPNIVQVFDLGCVGRLYYIAMEYLPGRTLAQMLRRAHQGRDRIPVPVLLSMMASCCDGLHYAHDLTDEQGRPLGMLHRDISPSNVMLTFAGRVSLLDFGVATARGRYQTQSGAIKGKFHYLAPERVRGEPHDCRSDIYSLGVVLYQCLTLRWPFRAPNDYELLRQIAHDTPPPPRNHNPLIPEALEQLVLRAMARDPADRPADAAAMGNELREYLRRNGQSPEPRELAGYLADLYPEAPEAASLRRRAEPADGEELASSEILLDGDVPIEVELPGDGSASVSGQALAEGSPAGPFGGPPRSGGRLGSDGWSRNWTRSRSRSSRGSEPPGGDSDSAVASRTRSSTGETLAQREGGTGETQAPREGGTGETARDDDDDVAIFPEPTRAEPMGSDVFGGYARGTRRSRRLKRDTEPAFFGAKQPLERPIGWWSGVVEPADSSPSERIPSPRERDEHG